MITIAIVEDVDDFREAIASIIQSTEGLFCAYTFSTAEAALETLREYPVDIVLMDIQLPGMSGIECMRQLKKLQPQMNFLMCTTFHDDESIFNALRAGATGYLLKGDEPAVIIEAIWSLYKGGSPMNAHIARRVIESFHSNTSEECDYTALLTKREVELLTLLSKGYRYKEIAGQLFISVETVRKHINNIYTKLQVQSRMEAVNKVFGRMV